MPFFERIRKVLEFITSIDPDEILFEITRRRKTQELIIRLNTREQLFDGINADGESLEDIGGSYAPLTIAIKEADGLPTDRVTLFQTGDFYDSFRIEPYVGGFVIDADTDKEDGDLTRRWGNDILGLTDESQEELVIYYINEIIKELNKGLSNL